MLEGLCKHPYGAQDYQLLVLPGSACLLEPALLSTLARCHLLAAAAQLRYQALSALQRGLVLPAVQVRPLQG